jgi:hypothetical protein
MFIAMTQKVRCEHFNVIIIIILYKTELQYNTYTGI